MNIDAAADAAPFVSAGHFADVDEVMGPSRGRPISRAQELTQASGPCSLGLCAVFPSAPARCFCCCCQIALIAVIGSPLLISFDLTGAWSEVT